MRKKPVSFVSSVSVVPSTETRAPATLALRSSMTCPTKVAGCSGSPGPSPPCSCPSVNFPLTFLTWPDVVSAGSDEQPASKAAARRTAVRRAPDTMGRIHA
jgi:hypothetical protein